MISLESAPIVEQFLSRIRERVLLCEKKGVIPHLAIVLVGTDEDSLWYIDIKNKIAKQLGIVASLYHIEEIEAYEKVAEVVKFLGEDEDTHGIIIQLPLPQKFSSEQTDSLISLIPEKKDVDGLRGSWKNVHYSGVSQQLLEQPQAHALPPMVGAILSTLDYYNISLTDKKIVTIGHGRLVGQPVEEFLSRMGYSVSSIDESTEKPLDITKEADILITGTGEPDLVTYQWIKEGATVINCARDVHVDSVSQVAGALSPENGGVGRLTVCWLLHNVTESAFRSAS